MENGNILSQEKRAKLEKSRTLSDAELLKKDAKYIFDKNGEKILVTTDSQTREIHEEMERDLTKERFYPKGLRNKELFPEKPENSEKFDKFFSEMNEQVMKIDSLISNITNNDLFTKYTRKRDIILKAIEGDLKSKIEKKDFCCLSDDYFEHVGESPDFEDSNKINLSVLNFNRKEISEELGLALDRLIFEIVAIAVEEKGRSGSGDSNDYDSYRIDPIVEYYAKRLGVPQREAAAGIMNRINNQRIAFDADGEIKIVDRNPGQ